MQSNDVGNLFIVAAPSGGGKTSLVARLVASLANITLSISHTTREQRRGEQDGVHYFFVNEDEFEQMIQAEQFLEHARVFNHHYGTSLGHIQEHIAQGVDVVLDIDWQGAQQIKNKVSNAVTIFILPPSLNALRERLVHRQRDSADVIRERMQQAQDEMSHYSEFDYLIINDDFEKAASELVAIVTAQRLIMSRQMRAQEGLLSELLGG